MRHKKFRLWVALITLNLMNFVQIVEAATIVPATSPLANISADVVRPNIMYVLDNSGSMAWDYLPDYVSAGYGGTGSQICWSGTNDSSALATCNGVGSTSTSPNDVAVPFTTSDINYVYYNPAIYYQPPIKADKTNYPNSTVTAASIDGFDSTPSSTLNFQTGTTISGGTITGTRTSGSTTINGLASSEGLLGSFVTGTGIPAGAYVTAVNTLTNSLTLSAAATSGTATSTTLTFKTGAYKHQVYCASSGVNDQNKRGGDTGSVCRETTDTTADPDKLYPTTTTGSIFTNVNSYNGAAYYYTMSPMEYCTDSVFTNCVPGSADATHAVPALYRWCQTYTPSVLGTPGSYSDCQDLRDDTHKKPDYLGSVKTNAVATQATAVLTISSYIPGKTITALTVNGTNVIGATTFTAGSGGLTDTTLIASAICTAISTNTALSGYNCTTTSTNTLTIKANVPPAHASYIAPNGYDVVVSSSATGSPTSASGTITIAAPSGATVVDDVIVGGSTSLLPVGSKPHYFGTGATATTIATKLVSLIAGNSGSSGYTASNGGGTSPTITITSTTVGPSPNGSAVTLTATAVPAKATVTSNSAVTASGGSIGAISVAKNATFGGATTTLENAQTFAASATTANVATQIRTNVLPASAFTTTTLPANVTIFTAPIAAANQYNGQIISIPAGGVAGTAVTGSLTITNTGAIKVTGLTVGATSLIAAGSWYSNTASTSSSICSGLASLVTLGGFTASCGGTSTLSLTGPQNNTFNGATITLSGSLVNGVGVNPTGLIKFTTSGTSGSNATINKTLSGSTATVMVGTDKLTGPFNLGNSKTATTAASSLVGLIGTGGVIKAYIGSNAITPTCSTQAVTTVCLVDTTTLTNGRVVTIGTTSNFSTLTVPSGANLVATAGGSPPPNATTSPTQTTNAAYAAPTSGPATMNTNGAAAIPNYAASLSVGTFPAATNGASGSATATLVGGLPAGYAAQGVTNGSLSGGTNPGVIATNASATAPSTLTMAGGQEPDGGRINVGKFTRVDIVPSTASYTKASGRTDCAGTDCTYAEELQNFANWYSYYHTRLLMAKTTSTLAFDKLDSKYRVGFDLLSNYNSSGINLEVAQFADTGETTNQRTNWWTKLTETTTSGSTPLRSSLLKMGKYYGAKLFSAPAIPATKAVGTMQINSSTSQGATITSLTVDGIQMLSGIFTVAPATGCTSTCDSTERSNVAGALYNQIIALTNTAYQAQVALATGYTATRSGSKITFTANTAGDASDGNVAPTKTGTITLGLTATGGANVVAAVTANTDPVQYSCQQNFALMVTDGYWNTDVTSSMTQLDGTTAIANQDNTNTGYTTRPSFDGNVASTTCTDSSGVFFSCGTLADIAMYYYLTDIRDASLGNETSGATGQNVATNDVFKSPTDNNKNQHMQLFTMALGIPGTLRYRSDYLTANSGDFYDINTTNPVVASQKNWPAVKPFDPTTIDDLWHAAVNGRGKYFSARDPVAVVNGLSEALASVQVREGAAAAAATSNLQPISGDNFAYVASYTTNEWSGDLQARIISTTTGAVSAPANTAPNDCVGDSGCPWSAKKILDNRVWSTRKIYMAPTSGSTLRLFTYANLTPTELPFFDPAVGNVTYGTSTLTQYASVYATDPTEITDAKMIDFLRGDTSLEVANTGSLPEVWRDRKHVLGDIVNTQPTFVRKAVSTTYEDSGYSAFVTAQADREGVVYVSGNDGMLHAFASDDFFDGTASGGEELWAFIPTQALPYLRNLADTDYVHRYYVDGPISVSDVNFGSSATPDWHTILVAGMGSGGNAYFALDITDPVAPKFLWEFTDTNLGLTYSNPSMNKLPNGEWAVLFTSGYNNADGKGYLYAVNPETGALKTGYPLTTGSGTAASPSNLGKIAAWVDNLQINNTATDVYAGDMDGDLWRFDLTTSAVSRLAHLTDAVTPTPNAQPITTKPELTRADGNRVIYVGTGRYLGLTDTSDLRVQSFYAIKDTETSPSPNWNTPRTETGTINGVSGAPMFIQRKLIALKNDGSQITRTNASGATVDARQICTGTSSQVDSSTGDCVSESGEIIDWAQHGGWYFDLPDGGERMNVDMNLTLGTLTIPSNVPASSACVSGGYGWVNYVDFKTGLEIDTSTMIVSEKIANALIVGLNVIKVGDKLVAIVTTSDFNHEPAEPPGTPGKFKGKRDLWRELDPY